MFIVGSFTIWSMGLISIGRRAGLNKRLGSCDDKNEYAGCRHSRVGL